MIDYIVIESQKEYRKIYHEIIDNIMFKNNIVYDIKEENTIDLNNKFSITKNSLKIYIINICLSNMKSIIKFVNKIREVDLNSEIIFISSDEIINNIILKKARKVYCIIDKMDNLRDKLKKELKNIIKCFINHNDFFPLDKKGDLELSLNSILYIYRETTERKLYVVTETNKYPVSLTLSEALTKCNNNFKQIHRACIVNTDKVILYNWNENYFILNNNEKVFMCSKKYKDIINEK